jgi:DNA-binding transcriptional regulator YiaG
MNRLPTKPTARSITALAAAIRRLRERLELSQGQFAREVGVSQQTVSDWEQGKRLRQFHVVLRLIRLLEKQ